MGNNFLGQARSNMVLTRASPTIAGKLRHLVSTHAHRSRNDDLAGSPWVRISSTISLYIWSVCPHCEQMRACRTLYLLAA